MHTETKYTNRAPPAHHFTKRSITYPDNLFENLVRPAGIEPATLSLEG
jgi:hypothetical protein